MKTNKGGLIVSDCGHKFRAFPNKLKDHIYRCPVCNKVISTLLKENGEGVFY